MKSQIYFDKATHKMIDTRSVDEMLNDVSLEYFQCPVSYTSDLHLLAPKTPSIHEIRKALVKAFYCGRQIQSYIQEENDSGECTFESWLETQQDNDNDDGML